MHSAIYKGQLTHQRLQPTSHRFSYPIFMLWLDLAELKTVFSGRLFWSARRPALGYFRRQDYLAPHQRPLDQVVRDLVKERTGQRPEGRICLLAHVRLLGVCFNPVVFYYCYDSADQLQAIVADITNTPWGERYAYVLERACATAQASSLTWHLKKAFHVSPFLPMDMDLQWRFTLPGQTLAVHMENHQEEKTQFAATLRLHRWPLDSRHLAAVLIQFPLMTVSVVWRIYWQAFRIWLKRVPFYPHPKSL